MRFGLTFSWLLLYKQCSKVSFPILFPSRKTTYPRPRLIIIFVKVHFVSQHCTCTKILSQIFVTFIMFPRWFSLGDAGLDRLIIIHRSCIICNNSTITGINYCDIWTMGTTFIMFAMVV